MNRSITISEHIKSLSHNYEIFVESFPKVYLAAEYINDIFDQIFRERFILNEGILWMNAVSNLLFGLHLSWIESFYLKAGGQQDVGLMTERRAIEFACYISKVANSNKRAELWYKHLTSSKNVKDFSNKFKIPCCYLSNKYSHLVSLLVHYDFTSNFGSHANVNSLVTKHVVKGEDISSFSFQDLGEWIPPSCIVSILIGSLLINSVLTVLKNSINGYDDFIKKVKVKDELIQNAQIEAYTKSNNTNPNPTILKAILENNMDRINELFEKIKEKCSEKNKNYKRATA